MKLDFQAFKQLEQVGPSLGQHSDELMMIGEEQEFEKPEQDEIPVLEKIDDREKSAEMDEIGEDFEEIHIEQNPEVSPAMTPTEESNKTPVIVRPQVRDSSRTISWIDYDFRQSKFQLHFCCPWICRI